MKRFKLLVVTGDILLELFKKGNLIINDNLFVQFTEGIPEGTSIVATKYDILTDRIYFHLENKEFDEVPEAARLSELDVQFRAYSPDKIK